MQILNSFSLKINDSKTAEQYAVSTTSSVSRALVWLTSIRALAIFYLYYQAQELTQDTEVNFQLKTLLLSLFI